MMCLNVSNTPMSVAPNRHSHPITGDIMPTMTTNEWIMSRPLRSRLDAEVNRKNARGNEADALFSRACHTRVQPSASCPA